MYSPLKNFIFVSIKKYRYACFYLLCKDHGSALLCCRARSHSPEIRNGGCAELERLLRVNTKIAAENRLRFHDFCSEENRSMPAVCAYTGAVFKRILPKDFSAEDFRYAQEHLRITSFLYGLLRPLDGIKPYRLEGDVRLPEKGGISMFDY